MENRRDSLVVILAGYPEEMEDFISRNPGLNSGISFHVHFRDYAPAELLEILKMFVRESGMEISGDAESKALDIFGRAVEEKDFGNGRFVRNLFEGARMKMASRILRIQSPSEKEIRTLTADDFFSPIKRDGKRKQMGFSLL